MPQTHPALAVGSLLLFNLLGALLIFTWLSPDLLFWTEIDDAVFFTTNGWLTEENGAWVWLVAVTNARLFDVASLLVLLGIYLWALSRDPVREQRLLRWGGIGVTMQIGRASCRERV